MTGPRLTGSAPLTSEKARVEALDERLAQISIGDTATETPSTEISAAIQSIKDIEIGTDWDEFLPRAVKARAEALQDLEGMLKTVLDRERDAAELAKLKADMAERDQRDKEREARELADRNQREAREQIERDKREAVEQAERQKAQAAEQEAREKALAEEQAEAYRKAASEQEAQTERDRVAALEQAEMDRKAAVAAAVIADREAAAAKVRAEKEAEEQRKADLETRNRVSREIRVDIGNQSIMGAIEAMVDGKIRHITVKF